MNRIWRDAKVRAVGLRRAKILVTAAEHCVGNRDVQEAARIEFQMLLSDYELQTKRETELMEIIKAGNVRRKVLMSRNRSQQTTKNEPVVGRNNFRGQDPVKDLI